MKSLQQIYSYKSSSLDGRDVSRLSAFIPVEDWPKFGLKVAEGVDLATIKIEKLTKANIMKHLKRDLAFAFEKALGKRGISASLMNDVIKMWMWVLDDELADCEEYAQYGLPLLKKVAVKYKLENPIGEDKGDEYKYSSEADY